MDADYGAACAALYLNTNGEGMVDAKSVEGKQQAGKPDDEADKGGAGLPPGIPGLGPGLGGLGPGLGADMDGLNLWTDENGMLQQHPVNGLTSPYYQAAVFNGVGVNGMNGLNGLNGGVQRRAITGSHSFAHLSRQHGQPQHGQGQGVFVGQQGKLAHGAHGAHGAHPAAWQGGPGGPGGSQPGAAWAQGHIMQGPPQPASASVSALNPWSRASGSHGGHGAHGSHGGHGHGGRGGHGGGSTLSSLVGMPAPQHMGNRKSSPTFGMQQGGHGGHGHGGVLTPTKQFRRSTSYPGKQYQPHHGPAGPAPAFEITSAEESHMLNPFAVAGQVSSGRRSGAGEGRVGGGP